MDVSIKYDEDFYRWICTQPADTDDSARNLCIQDTRDAMRMIDNGEIDEKRMKQLIRRGCHQARMQLYRLKREYNSRRRYPVMIITSTGCYPCPGLSELIESE